MSKPRVLVVDDDPDIRALVQYTLDPHFEVETARDGKQACELLDERPDDFAAMVLDLMMPVKSGFDVLEAIRASPETESLPVVVLTARTDREAIVDAYVGGGHVFMAKPFDGDELIVKLRDLIRKSAAARQAGRLQRLLNLNKD